MSKASMMVTYTPTEAEHPMLGGQPQGAIITGWNEETEKANLTVFPNRAQYVMTKEGVVEGAVPGTFQQPASETRSAPAPRIQLNNRFRASAASPRRPEPNVRKVFGSGVELT